MKPLILFFSHGGNTRTIAADIGAITGAELAEIEPVTPYPANEDACDAQAKAEVASGATPPVKPLAINPNDYDTVYLGTPVWWDTLAPPVRTVLAAHSWEGKTVYPFATHGGAPAGTLEDMAALCAGAKVMPGLTVCFGSDAPPFSNETLKAWATGK